MAQNLDLRCVLVPAPKVLGPKHVSNPEYRSLHHIVFAGRPRHGTRGHAWPVSLAVCVTWIYTSLGYCAIQAVWVNSKQQYILVPGAKDVLNPDSVIKKFNTQFN